MSHSPDVCDLCGLPLRNQTHSTTLDASERQYRFCCIGCRQVFTMLMEASDSPDPADFKTTDLFKKCLELGVIPRTEDDLAAIRRNAQDEVYESNPETVTETDGEGGLELYGKITDMWCPACSWVIEAALRKMTGILSVSCHFSTDRLKCEYDPVQTSPEQIIKKIKSLGYRSVSWETDGETAESRRELIRLLVSAFLTMNIMMFSFALYSGFFSSLTQESIDKLSWPPFIMATVVLFYGGRWIFQKALQGFRSVAFGMETLIGTGALCAYGYSVVHFFSESIHLYFDTASMLITLTLLGKMLERSAKDRVQASLEGFLDLLPTKVRLCTDEIPNGRYASSKLLNKKDIFRVVTGETVPADGLITTGEGVIDESSLTGEAEPVRKRAGDRLKSGTEVVKGDLFVRAEAVGKASTLGQMTEIMEKALSEKTEWEGKTDRILQFFVPAILILALGTGVVWFFVKGSIEAGMIRAVTVMVISCPCALGIAIPLVRVAGISVAGNKGILVRDFSAFEQSERIDTFVFDKTGTVTTGRWSLLKIHALPPHHETDILSIAAALERISDHYIAAEILREARSRGISESSDALLDHIAHVENGVSGTFNHRRIKIGSKSFVQSEWKPCDLPHLKKEESAVYMTMDENPCAVFVFGDRVREGVPEMIRTLHTNGYGTMLISGDGEETTRAIGETIGVHDSEGGKLPRDKAERVAALQKGGHSVAMVGDGINDAPALVQSDLSFAVHSGSHLGQEASQITLMGGNPVQILDYMSLAKGINRKIFQNLLGALIYNVVGIPVAMAGLLSPLLAVIAMFLSSLTVTGNTLLLIKKYS